jgi:membrane protein DedA with SNARE-associated domain
MPDLQSLADVLREAYGSWGYPIIVGGALLENTALLGLVLPGGSLVLLGAIYAQQGVLSLPLVLLCGWMGMVLGTSVDFSLGRFVFRSSLARTRWQQRIEPRLNDAGGFLARHGTWALLLAHFVGHVRSFVAIAAGMSPLPYLRFLSYELIAALVWNVVWVLAGYVLGLQVSALQPLVGGIGLALIVALAVAFLVYRRVAARRAQSHHEC